MEARSLMPEVWLPGSKEPFRPLNPWGREMPKVKRPVREPLYQLIVTRVGRGMIPFGPKMKKDAVDQLFEAVSAGIRVGVEKELTDPHVVRCL